MSGKQQTLFDKRFEALRRRRASGTMAPHALHRFAADRINERLLDIKQPLPSPYEWNSVAPDAQTNPHGLITSHLTLQHENDLQGALADIYTHLTQGGLFLGVMLGGQSLHELRTCLMEAEIALKGGASPRVAPTWKAEDVSTLLASTGFHLPVLDTERITLVYKDLPALMRDLRQSGCANNLNARTRSFTGRTLFEKANALYAERFAAESGGITATIDLLYLHGWRE